MSQQSAEKLIFQAALFLTDPVERAKYLDVACQDDDALRERVESLLRSATEEGDFLRKRAVESLVEAPVNNQPPAAGAPSTKSASNLTASLGERVGNYKLLEQIGEGGFGAVYMADQQTPIQRRVALKIIKEGMDTRHVIARFEAERQALALMDHPNIAKVLDAGATETGRPYFVMELVRGIPVTTYCDDRNLSTKERLAVFVEICSAVQHAHQKGIIHRDIKPSNILVTTNGDRPVPKVIDFGIAKATQGPLTEKTLFTQFRQFIGTPAYMSPEQAQMSAVDVDTRSDIYSLGVLLYELLTGKTPLDSKELLKAGYEEVCRRIREEEAPTPSKRISSLEQEELKTLAKSRQLEPAEFPSAVRGDLDWIVMKAVEKDRARRYGTAEGLAEDIRRHLSQLPVSAAPPSATYRLRRLARRNRGLLLTAAAVAAALVIGTTIAVWQAVRATNASFVAQTEAERARDAESIAVEQRNQLAKAERDARAAQAAAVESEQAVRRNLYVNMMGNAQRHFDKLDTPRAVELLLKCIPGPDEPDLRGFEWRWLWNQCHQEEFTLQGHTKLLRDMRFSRDGKWLVTGARDGYVRLWNMETLEEAWSFPGGVDCNGVDISPDNRLLVANFYKPVDHPANALWNIEDPKSPTLVTRFGGDDKLHGKLGFAPDGTIWNGGKQFDQTGKLLRYLASGNWINTGQALSADGKTLAWLRWNGVGTIIDIPNQTFGQLPTHIGYGDTPVKGIAISPADDDVIVTGCESLGVCIWNRGGELVRRLSGFDERLPLAMISFSKDGDLLAVRQTFGAIHVLETDTWERVAIVRPPRAGNTVAFSPVENNLLVAGGEDGTIRGWRVRPNRPVDVTLDHPATVQLLRFSPDGSTLAVGLDDASVWFRSVDTGEKMFSTPSTWERSSGTLAYWHSYSTDFIAFSPDSRYAAIIGPQTEVSIWDLQRQEEVAREVLPPESESRPQPVYWSLEFSPAGDRLYAGVRFEEGRRGRLDVFQWEPEIPRLTKRSGHATEAIRTLAISPNGAVLASQPPAPWTNLHRLPQIDPPQVLRSDMKARGFGWVMFSPDGSQLAVVGDGSQVWNVATGALVHKFPRKGPLLEHVSWSADGRRLAVSDSTLRTQLWELSTEQVVATFPGRVSAFSPDGTVLAVGRLGSEFWAEDEAGRVTLCYAPPLAEIDRRRVVQDVNP